MSALVAPRPVVLRRGRDAAAKPLGPRRDVAGPVISQLVQWDVDDPTLRPFSETCLHRLGNLVLDTYSLGGSRSDRPFAERIPLYQSSGLRSQREIVERFASKAQNGNLCWDVAATRERQSKLVEFARNQICSIHSA